MPKEFITVQIMRKIFKKREEIQMVSQKISNLVLNKPNKVLDLKGSYSMTIRDSRT